MSGRREAGRQAGLIQVNVCCPGNADWLPPPGEPVPRAQRGIRDGVFLLDAPSYLGRWDVDGESGFAESWSGQSVKMISLWPEPMGPREGKSKAVLDSTNLAGKAEAGDLHAELTRRPHVHSLPSLRS